MTEALTALEARSQYGIPTSRIYRWVHAGKVRPVTAPGRPAAYPLSRIQELNRAAEAHPRAKRAA